MMRVVAVSRVLDEADVIEPFIRHHAALVDLHIVLDNGSTDGTVEILRALHAEGLNLHVYQTSSPIFLEQTYNNGLYRFAIAEMADWVMFLDADELLVVRDARPPAELLDLVPDGITCLRIPGFRYRPTPGSEHPFAALRYRAPDAEMHKIAARRVEPARISVYAGNHFAFVDGQEDPGLAQDLISLAHVPARSPLQYACKVVLGRLKPMASGENASAHFSTHRLADFEALKADPSEWLARHDPRLAHDADVNDPVAYRGGPLRHTQGPDELGRMIRLFAAQAETLARSHGAILDRKRLIRRDMLNRGAAAKRLF